MKTFLICLPVLGLFFLPSLKALESLAWVDLSCDHASYAKEDFSCLGNVQLTATPFSLYADTLKWDEQGSLLLLEGAPVKAEYHACLKDLQGGFLLKAEKMTAYCNQVRKPEQLKAEGKVYFCSGEDLKIQAEAAQIACEGQKPRLLTAGPKVDLQYKEALHAEGDLLRIIASEDKPTYQVWLESEKGCPLEKTGLFQGTVKSLHYDTATTCGEAKAVDGSMQIQWEGANSLHIQAEDLLWDETRGHLKAQGNIELVLYRINNQEVALEPYCTLKVQGSLIAQCELYPKLICRRIQIDGQTQLQTQAWGKLENSGRTLIDCGKSKIVATGLSQGDEVSLENQVHLETLYGKMQSDRLDLEVYPDAAHTFSVHAQGSVGIETSKGQYVLAHELHYDARKAEGMLVGKPSQRVLFWEPRLCATISAVSCHYTLADPVKGGMRVKGHGDVRMTLLGTERKKLETRFPFHE